MVTYVNKQAIYIYIYNIYIYVISKRLQTTETLPLLSYYKLVVKYNTTIIATQKRKVTNIKHTSELPEIIEMSNLPENCYFIFNEPTLMTLKTTKEKCGVQNLL